MVSSLSSAVRLHCSIPAQPLGIALCKWGILKQPHDPKYQMQRGLVRSYPSWAASPVSWPTEAQSLHAAAPCRVGLAMCKLWFQSSEAAVTQLQFLIRILRSFVGERDRKKMFFLVWDQPEDFQASAVILMCCEKEWVKGLTAAPFLFCEVPQTTDLTLCCLNQREEQSALCCSQACSQCGLGSAPAQHTAVQSYAAWLLMHPYLNVVGEVSTACVLCIFGLHAEGIAASRDINAVQKSRFVEKYWNNIWKSKWGFPILSHLFSEEGGAKEGGCTLFLDSPSLWHLQELKTCKNQRMCFPLPPHHVPQHLQHLQHSLC